MPADGWSIGRCFRPRNLGRVDGGAVQPFRFANKFDGVVAETGNPRDRFLAALAVLDRQVKRMLETGRRMLPSRHHIQFHPRFMDGAGCRRRAWLSMPRSVTWLKLPSAPFGIGTKG